MVMTVAGVIITGSGILWMYSALTAVTSAGSLFTESVALTTVLMVSVGVALMVGGILYRTARRVARVR